VFEITLADVRISEVGDATYTDDVVKVPLTFQALYESGAGTDFKATVTNSEATVVADATPVASDKLPTDFGPSTIAVQRI
jgi:hypothetical protein